MTDKIDTPESVRMFARDLVPAIGHLFRHVEERDIGKMNLLLTLLERYAAHLEKCAGVWIDVRKQMPSDYRGLITGLESAGFARDMEWCDGRFKYWEDGTEAFPTHWLAMRTPGESK